MKTPLLLSPSPVRALSTPALCITFGLFFKASVRKRGYNVQAQPQVSLIYNEPPVLKVSPLRAQETECRHEVGQISPGVCHWPGLREPAQLSYLGCREHPTIPHQGWCLVWPKTPHLWGHSQVGVRAPTASSAPRRCFRRSVLQGCYRWSLCSPFLGWCVFLLCSAAGEWLLPPSPTDALGQGSVSQHASLRVW